MAGNGTKIHLIMGKDTPISLQLTGADVHDSVPVLPMLIPLERLGIQRFVADRGYDDDKIRNALRDQGIHPEIPPKKNRIQHRRCDKTVYKWRWRIEAFFGKLKENRRIALRVDKLDMTFEGFIALALIKIIVC